VSGLPARLRRIPSWQVTLAVALLGLGFLIAIQLGTEGPRIRYSSSERPPLLETANELRAAQEQLEARILELRAQIGDAEASAAGNDELVRRLNDELRDARLVAGLVELEGPGLVVRLDDSTQPVPPDVAAADYLVSANDLRDVLTELWLAGAEAISVNSERIVVGTALTDIGSSVLVNSSYLQPPYDISVVGPPELYDRLTTAPGFIDFTRTRVQGYGLQLGFVPAGDVVVAAYSGVINLVQARPVPSPASAP
jgi:uncharacterized protein YlxW (UPF0749 family)